MAIDELQNLKRIWASVWQKTTLYKLIDTVHNPSENLADIWIKSHLPYVKKMMNKLPVGKVILDAGCGFGQWVFYTAEKGYFSCGIELSEGVLIEAVNYIRKNDVHNIHFIEGDIRNISLKERSVNCIFSFGVIEHFKNPMKIIAEFYRVLDYKGKVLITVPNVFCVHTFTRPMAIQLGIWDLGYECSYSPKKLGRLFAEQGFRILEEGIMPSGLALGITVKNIPFVGRYFLKYLMKFSFFVEKKQNIFGFISYIIAEKNE